MQNSVPRVFGAHCTLALESCSSHSRLQGLREQPRRGAGAWEHTRCARVRPSHMVIPAGMLSTQNVMHTPSPIRCALILAPCFLACIGARQSAGGGVLPCWRLLPVGYTVGSGARIQSSSGCNVVSKGRCAEGAALRAHRATRGDWACRRCAARVLAGFSGRGAALEELRRPKRPPAPTSPCPAPPLPWERAR